MPTKEPEPEVTEITQPVEELEVEVNEEEPVEEPEVAEITQPVVELEVEVEDEA